MKMKKQIILAIAMPLILAMVFTGCGSSSTNGASKTKTYNGTVKIAISSWTGFAPLYVAKEKGYFKKNGVNVELDAIQSASDRRSALASDRIQAFASTVDTHIITEASNIKIAQVLALDTSYGGDGVLVKNDIKNFNDLKGKTVALDTNGVSSFWFQYLLKKHGMKIDDVKVTNMSSDSAGAAFMGQKVDAAVTWQPWLSKTAKSNFGHVLVSSKETPGLIVDSLALKKDFISKYPKTVQAIVNSWFDALDYIKKNQADADNIMAKAMGQSVDDFKSSEADINFYDKAQNVTYFGQGSKHGLIWDVTDEAATIWLNQKMISSKPDIKDMIDGTFVNK